MIKKKPTKNYPKALIITIVLLSAVLAIANIVASNTVATNGQRLELLRLQASKLQVANQKLERSISEKRSLSFIEALAQEAGFTPITNTLSLTPPEPLAQAP